MTVAEPRLGTTVLDGPMSPDQFMVRDIRLPPHDGTRALWLREIVDRSHPRISELWWALYDNGARSDVWHFTALPDRTENKMLSNYAIQDASSAGTRSVVLRIRGSMFRPGGAWWIVGKEFVLSAAEGGLALTRVRNTFGIFHGGIDSRVSVSTERELGGRFEERTVDPAPERLLRACGFRNPLSHDDARFSWEEFASIAQCVTRRRNANVTTRALDAPSFVERGGRPN